MSGRWDYEHLGESPLPSKPTRIVVSGQTVEVLPFPEMAAMDEMEIVENALSIVEAHRSKPSLRERLAAAFAWRWS